MSLQLGLVNSGAFNGALDSPKQEALAVGSVAGAG